MDDVDDEDKVGEAQGGELHQPEAEERDRREEIVADVGTAGLNGVAHKALLLILVERVTSEEEDQDSEEDHHNQPHLPYKKEEIEEWQKIQNISQNYNKRLMHQ